MKSYLTLATLLVLSITFVTTANGQTCTCKAPGKGVCAAEVTCRSGCIAICSSDDACYTSCGDMDINFLQMLITIKVKISDSKKIAATLTRKSKKEVEFTPWNAQNQFSHHFKNAPLWSVLELLLNYGEVKVGGVNFSNILIIRKMMLKSKKLSLNFNGVPVKNVVDKLSFLSGLSYRVTSRDPEALVSISLEDVTLDEVIERVSAQTGVKITSE